ncbi:MAG: glycosyltransferase [Methanomassiliicoccales archaeon]|nr:glycosyltransferase [Methanomassiliicoccales archaeon]
MDTLKIVMTSTFFPPYHLGGDAIHVKLLKEELEARGHEVHVVHNLDAYRLKGGKKEATRQENVHPLRSTFGPTSARATYLTGRNRGAERLLEKVIEDVRPDLIHHHNISLLGQGILDVGDSPKIYTAHDYWSICPRSDLMRAGRELCTETRCTSCCLRTGRPPQFWRGEGILRRFRTMKYIIAPSTFMSKQLQRFLGLNSIVLPNFTKQLESSMGPTTGHFVYAGVLEPGKGVDALLDAFATRDTKLELHVYGSGSLERRAREVEIATNGRVKYLGFQTGKPLWDDIASATAMIMPSRVNDNCPLSCVEALSLGVPLIVSDRGGLPELVRDPDCGLVVEPEAPIIAIAATTLTSDTKMREILASNARKRFESRHTASAYLRDYLDLVSRVR